MSLKRDSFSPFPPSFLQIAWFQLRQTGLEIKGASMGSNFVVVYACLFFCHLEDSSPAFLSPFLNYYKRYIDDIFRIWIEPLDNLNIFLASYAHPLQDSIQNIPSISPSLATILESLLFKGPRFKTLLILHLC